MAFGQDGKLYVTVFGQGDVAVLMQDERVVERVRTTGRQPTNVAFGTSGDRRIYVTRDELGQVET